MKKYIRTEDGVYEFNENMHITNNKLINNFVNYEDIFGNKDILQEDLGKVLSQADTIDELCDEFVEVIEDSNLPKELTHHIKGKAMDSSQFCIMGKIYKNNIIYGAIWTSKGLIFVSKYNKEKGKMVLI